MASEKPTPALLDSVKASATKFKEIKSTLDARQRELETLKTDIESQRGELEAQVNRFRSEREEFEREKGQVQAARSLAERDLAGARIDREKISTEEKRVQDWARTLNEREKAIKEAEDRLRRLELELTDHLKDSEGKIQALVEREQMSAQRERALAETIDRLSTMEKGLADRDRKLAKREEELIKLQNERLNAMEARERELLKISEEMFARQKESAAQHESFVELQTTLREELTQLASQREMLALKEKSLLDAEKYLAAALEAGGLELPAEPEETAPPPPPIVERRSSPAITIPRPGSPTRSSGNSRPSRFPARLLARPAVRGGVNRHRVHWHAGHPHFVPLSRDLSPWIGVRHGSRDERPDHVRDEDDLAERDDERSERREPVQRPQRGVVVVHATRHALEAEEVHREEDQVHADEGEGEVPAGEPLGIHAPGHPREPEVESREDAEDRAAKEDVVQVGDDPVGVLERIVERDRCLEHPVDAADDEHRDEADGEEHRRLELDRSTPHRRDPVEHLDPARHRDRERDDHEREARGDRDAGREHVVHPDAERQEPDCDGREGDRLVPEDRLG